MTISNFIRRQTYMWSWECHYVAFNLNTFQPQAYFLLLDQLKDFHLLTSCKSISQILISTFKLE